MSLKSLTLLTTLNLICALPLPAQDAPAVPGGTSAIADGPFQPDDQSLQQYRCPDWFRDAKLGIWAVWGPEAVPMQGDWYARHLYEHDGFDDKAGEPTGQSRHNKYHLERYGHPSKFGFKNIIPLWKAEKWEPDRLMELYKKAGAKYSCMIAMHHDNFDCWNSQFNRWNSVNMGPRRDIAAQWQEAARKQGLRFGMTEHLAASWWFYGVTKGADKTGPMAGVPYDGHDPASADLYWSGNAEPDFHYYGTNVPTAFKISAADLKPLAVVYDGSILPNASGRFVLSASDAKLHGDTPKYERSGGKDHIGCWAKADDFVSWNIKVLRPGKFNIEVTYSCDAHAAGSAFIVEVSGQTLTGKSASTGSWADYRTDNLGTLKFDQPGIFTLAVKPKSEPKWKVIGLKSIVLQPVGQE